MNNTVLNDKLAYMDSVEHFIRFDVANLYNLQSINLDDCCREVQKISGNPENRDKDWKQLFNEISSKKQKNNIGYEQINEDHLVKITIPPFLIEKKGEYFAFKEAIIGSTLRERNGGIMIKNPPVVLTKNYRHHHVSDGLISYGSDERWRQIGINFNQWYDLSEKTMLSRNIAYLLWEGRGVLESYQYKSHSFNRIERVAPMVATTHKDAQSYCRDTGIDRIFHSF